jgi:outer membrane protein assembly factor BamB
MLAQMSAVVYQLNTSGDMWYNHLFLKYLSNESIARSTGMQTSWESLLDTAIAFKPQLVQNHNTGETEVLVQDMANNVYLLNNIGRILWKVTLPEPVLSHVYQVDLYKNKKLQMLFNTRHHIYALDRLGNIVARFPIRLQSPAVGGLAVFDYDNDLNYRIMVACEDRKVYAYEKTGKQIDGWQFQQSEHPVQTDLCHYRSGGRDFIVFADKYKLYILDRQGKARITPEYNFPVGQQTVIATDPPRSSNPTHIVLTDTTGTPHFVSLTDGSIRKKEIKVIPSTHFFIFQDVDGDRQGDFIFAYNNKVMVYHQDGKQIMEIDTEEPVSMRPYIYEFAADDLKIGIVAPQKNLIYLYNELGKLHEGFPLTGSTLFSIGRLDKLSRNFNLFVGSKNNFIYNYPIN